MTNLTIADTIDAYLSGVLTYREFLDRLPGLPQSIIGRGK